MNWQDVVIAAGWTGIGAAVLLVVSLIILALRTTP